MTSYTQSAAQAFNRFGLGGRPDDAVPASPMTWLANQITSADTAPAAGGNLVTLPQALTLINNVETAPFLSTQQQAQIALLWAAMAAEEQSFLANAITTKTPFRERLVWFWSNHFAVMAGANGPMLALAGTYIRDAIRPNMTGTIAQMLQAAMLHPAMIYSLNANVSIGPQSALGIAHTRNGNPVSINENLGRKSSSYIRSALTQATHRPMSMRWPICSPAST